jgi:hypothetical protein
MKWVGGWGDADSISQYCLTASRYSLEDLAMRAEETMVRAEYIGWLRNMAEEGGDSWAPLMEEMTELLGITDWDSYVQMKAKYNPTQY